MSEVSDEVLGFGDSLALARLAWIRETAARLEQKGFAEYRRSDAFVLRRLHRSPSSLGTLGGELAMTRQGARKIIDTLVERGYARIAPDPADARKSNVVLTKRGGNYARAIQNVIAAMNAELHDDVSERDLESAARVLRVLRHLFTETRSSEHEEARGTSPQKTP